MRLKLSASSPEVLHRRQAPLRLTRQAKVGICRYEYLSGILMEALPPLGSSIHLDQLIIDTRSHFALA